MDENTAYSAIPMTYGFDVDGPTRSERWLVILAYLVAGTLASFIFLAVEFDPALFWFTKGKAANGPPFILYWLPGTPFGVLFGVLHLQRLTSRAGFAIVCGVFYYVAQLLFFSAHDIVEYLGIEKPPHKEVAVIFASSIGSVLSSLVLVIAAMVLTERPITFKAMVEAAVIGVLSGIFFVLAVDRFNTPWMAS